MGMADSESFEPSRQSMNFMASRTPHVTVARSSSPLNAVLHEGFAPCNYIPVLWASSTRHSIHEGRLVREATTGYRVRIRPSRRALQANRSGGIGLRLRPCSGCSGSVELLLVTGAETGTVEP